MSGWVRERLRAAIAAAATLTGKRFGLLVASSVVATSAIVAAAATNQPEASPLASILGHSLAADHTPVAAIEPAAEPEAEEPAEAIGHEATPAPEPSVTPTPEPEPTFVPEETAPGPEPEPTPEEEPTEEAETSPPPPATEAGRVKHVFIVSLVSSGYQPSFGKASAMPYLSGTLRPQGTLLGNYEVLDRATTPNGLAAISGQPPNKATREGCPVFESFPTTSTVTKAGIVTGEGCAYPVETQTLGDQLEAAGFSWRAYMEGMVSPTTGEPENCVYPATEPETSVTGGYSAQLNPFAHFHSLLDLGACATNDVPITELKKDLMSEAKTANVSYIAPDLCSAGVAGQCPEGTPTGAAAADAWLEEVVPEIVESPAFKKDGLLVVTFGGVNPAEPPVEGVPAPPAPTKPLKTGALLVSQFATAGGTDSAPYDPYALLRSTEELFGLSQLAKAADPKVKTFAPALLGENGGD
ncbi:MAG TPA: alkaline phosphatase family protein [Solirubrobacterales bacterium]|nr:alkaline phosphatase family protein [Solirubrobacterales bacterium]